MFLLATIIANLVIWSQSNIIIIPININKNKLYKFISTFILFIQSHSIYWNIDKKK